MIVADFVEGDRNEMLARRDAGQPAVPLSIGAVSCDGGCCLGQDREKGQGGDGSAGFLQEDKQRSESITRAFEFFGQRDSEEVGLGERPIQVMIVTIAALGAFDLSEMFSWAAI